MMTRWYVEETVVRKWWVEAETEDDAIIQASVYTYGPDEEETMDWSAEPVVEEM